MNIGLEDGLKQHLYDKSKIIICLKTMTSIIINKMKYIIFLHVFIGFLKENDILEIFVNEIKRQNKSYFITSENYINPLTIPIFSEVIKNEEYGRIFNIAFIWSETKEGHDFWRNISIQWKNAVENLDNKIKNGNKI